MVHKHYEQGKRANMGKISKLFSKASLTKNNQSGMVSIIVTMIIMIVLTLIVLGFAQLARREQRATLDRQLSTQAFYAAESGINDARRALANLPVGTPTPYEKQNCAPDGVVPNNSLDSGTNVAYTCLLIKQKLPNLVYGNVGTDKSIIVPINFEGGSSDLKISWQGKDGQTGIRGGTTNFPKEDTWSPASPNPGNVGVLRIDIVPVSNLDRATMSSSTYTAFLYPAGSGGSSSVPYVPGPSNQGKIVSVNCINPDPYKCAINITGLNGTTKYMMRMKSIYTASAVDISTTNPNVTLSGAQAEIDSTGKAQDVLKRLKVRTPIAGSGSGDVFLPEYALETAGDICKLYDLMPSSAGASTNNCP